MYVFSILFYVLKHKHLSYYNMDKVNLMESSYLLYGLTNIIFVLLFIRYDI